MADVLARLIADCDVRLAALDSDATRAAEDAALRAPRAIHAKSLELRRDLDQLQAMEHRLVRRFFSARTPLTAIPSASLSNVVGPSNPRDRSSG